MNTPRSDAAGAGAGARCYHCGDALPMTPLLVQEEAGPQREFCCEGCRTAYRIIAAGGLDGYYRYREEFGPRPDRTAQEAANLYDLQEEKLPQQKDGSKEITLRVEGIHCASCVWLNEKILGSLNGVLRAEVRLGTNRAYIKYDPERIRLRDMAAAAARVGYRLIAMDQAGERESGDESRDLLTRMGVAGFFAGNMMLVSVALYAGYFDSMERLTRNTLHLVSFLFAAPVLLYSAGVFFRGALASLRHRVLGMDLLIAAGISIAFCYSVYATIGEAGEVYFDSITFVVFAVLTGRFLESRLRLRGMQQVENLRAAGTRAVYLQPDDFDPSGETESDTTATESDTSEPGSNPGRPILAADVRAGQILYVPAGEPLPADGQLLGERAELDESLLTGEYRPVSRRSGDPLLSGSRPVGGSLYLKATRDHGESTLARLHDLVETGLRETSPGARLAARAAQWFVGFVLLAAAATFSFWLWRGEAGQGVHATIALLIVACPCALSLAIPIARVVALNAARKQGCLLKNGAALETLARTDFLVLDKTGTLTGGRPRVHRVEVLSPESEESLLALAREMQSLAEVRHPVAEAFRAAGLAGAADSAGTPAKATAALLRKAEYLPGRGVRGEDDSCTYLLGSRGWMKEHGVSGVDRPHEEGELPVYLARGRRDAKLELAAIFYLADEMRPEAPAVLSRLSRRMTPVLLTGDLETNARRVADRLDIQDVYAQFSPAEKLNFINQYRESKNVCMVGDGINDAAALAAADCGISFAEAAEISLYSADVLLLKNDLRQLSFLFDLAVRTRRKIIQNLTLSFSYNLILIPLACLGYIVPALGAAFMALSSLSVVANSLLLGRGGQ